MASEHEDQADCVGNIDCFDPDHCPFGLPWLQVWEVRGTHETLVVAIFWECDLCLVYILKSTYREVTLVCLGRINTYRIYWLV